MYNLLAEGVLEASSLLVLACSLSSSSMQECGVVGVLWSGLWVILWVFGGGGRDRAVDAEGVTRLLPSPPPLG